MSDPSSTGGAGAPEAGGKSDSSAVDGRRADPRTNTVVKYVLRTGLALAMVLLLVGLVIQLASGHDDAIGVKMFDLLAPRPLGERIMAVGTLMLALTPAAGVLSVLVSWIRERDGVFVVVGLIVVGVLSAAVLIGFG